MSESDFNSALTLDELERNALLEQAAQELDGLGINMGPSGTPTAAPEGQQLRNLRRDKVHFAGKPELLPIGEAYIPPRQPQIIPIAQLAQTHNFYWVPIPVLLDPDPEGNWAYNELFLQLVLSSADASSNTSPEPYIVYPEEKSDTLTTDVKPSVEVDISPFVKLGMEINHTFQTKKSLITHPGTGPGQVNLRIADTSSLNGRLDVAIIVQVPRAWKTLKIEGSMTAYHKLNFAPRRIIDVFSLFTKKVKDLFLGGIAIPAHLASPWEFDLTAKS